MSRTASGDGTNVECLECRMSLRVLERWRDGPADGVSCDEAQ